MTDKAYEYYPYPPLYSQPTQDNYDYQQQQHHHHHHQQPPSQQSQSPLSHNQQQQQRNKRRMTCRLFAVPIFMLVLFVVLTRSSNNGHQQYGGRGAPHSSAILVSDIKALTLHSDKWTKASRVASIPQLECIGGSASNQYHLRPKVVQCINKGSDGSDVQWECTAQLDSTVRFGKLDVSCEGYGYAGDPYVLKGFCGLRYELEYTNPERRNEYYQNESSSGAFFVWILIIAFVLFIFFWPSNNPAGGPANRTAPGPHGPGYPPGGPYGGPYPGAAPGYYPGAAPGTYPAPGVYPGDPYYGGCQPGAGAGWRPGFWTGAGLGYLFGRQNRNYNYGTGYGGGWNMGGSSWRSSSSSSSRGSGISAPSTGYASTSSR